MTHRTQDTYSLTNFREKTGEHLAELERVVAEIERLADKRRR